MNPFPCAIDVPCALGILVVLHFPCWLIAFYPLAFLHLLVLMLLWWSTSLLFGVFRCFHRPAVCWFVGGCSTGFVGILLHLSYPVGCGFKFRAVWPASSHLAVFREALFWLYIATVSFRHGLVNCRLLVWASVC